MSLLERSTYVGTVGRNGKLYKTTFGKFLQARKNGDVVPNPNNRKIDNNHVRSIKESFDFNSFGDILVVEKAAKGKITLQQRSGHHRSLALEEIVTENGGLGSSADLTLYIKVFPSTEACKMYVDEGNTKKLTANDLLQNSEYEFHHLMRTVLGVVDLSPYRGINFFTERNLTQLASVIYTMSTKSTYSDLPFKKVISNVAAIRKQAGIPKDDPSFQIKLSPKDKKALAEAMSYAISVVQSVIDNGDVFEGTRSKAHLSETAALVMSCKTFFIFLVWDKLVGGSITEIQATKLAYCLTAKEKDLISSAMIALNAKHTSVFTTEIYKIARTKIGYVKNDRIA